MHQRKYFNSNFFINEIFSVKKFPTYGMSKPFQPATKGSHAHGYGKFMKSKVKFTKAVLKGYKNIKLFFLLRTYIHVHNTPQ